VVSIKSKYVVLNDTGLPIEFKQRGTPDPGDPRYASYGGSRRFAGPLQPSERRERAFWGGAGRPRGLEGAGRAPGRVGACPAGTHADAA
jgi:hypothetical protein